MQGRLLVDGDLLNLSTSVLESSKTVYWALFITIYLTAVLTDAFGNSSSGILIRYKICGGTFNPQGF